MNTFTLTHVIDCDEDTFWKTFLSKDYNEELYKKHLEFPAFDIVEQREQDGRTFRKVVGQPKMNLIPAPVAKLMGPGFRYTEEGTFDPADKVFRFKMIPSALAGKLRNEASVSTEKAGDGKVRRVVKVTVEASVFGLGGLLESSVEKQIRDGWEKSAAFMNAFVKRGR